MVDVEALRSGAVFAALPEELRAEIVGVATARSVAAGEWLFREGGPADRLFVVRSGRVELLVESPEPHAVAEAGPGSVVGELALLAGDTTRTASARARRDCEVLEVPRERFESLLESRPQLAIALVRNLASLLRASRLHVPRARAPRTAAVVPLHDGAPAEEVAAGLVAELGRFGTVTRLAGIHPSDLPEALDRAERDYERVILAAAVPPGAPAAGADERAWSSACIGLADRIVAVAARSDPAPWVAAQGALKGCDLVLAEGDPSAWVQALAPRIRLHDSGDLAALVAGLARRLARRAVGIVLSGGGARALAHIGVLDELFAAGIRVDRVAGVSMGAYLGAQLADGATPDMLAWRVREEFVLRSPFSDVTAPVVALTRGTKARAMLERTFGERDIEDLEREFFCISTDLLHNRQVIHDTGPIVPAVGASMCVPGIFPPVTADGAALVDGGVLNNLPVEEMAGSADGPVIAVDVTTPVRRVGTLLTQPRRPRLERVAAVAREAVTGDPNPQLTIVEILLRTMLVGAKDTNAAARRHADLVIAPPVEDIVLLRFDHIDRAREAGRQAARDALAAAPGFVETFGSGG